MMPPFDIVRVLPVPTVKFCPLFVPLVIWSKLTVVPAGKLLRQSTLPLPSVVNIELFIGAFACAIFCAFPTNTLFNGNGKFGN